MLLSSARVCAFISTLTSILIAVYAIFTLQCESPLFPTFQFLTTLIYFCFFFHFRSCKTHPGPVIHLSDCPTDPSKVSAYTNRSSKRNRLVIFLPFSFSLSLFLMLKLSLVVAIVVDGKEIAFWKDARLEAHFKAPISLSFHLPSH